MKLIITGQQADWASKDLTVSGSDGIYLMEIELNDAEGLPSWASLTAYAVFKSSAMLAAYPDGIAVPINGGRAEIPAAILSEPGMLYVGVYGTNGSIVMPTIWAPAFCIALGCTEGSAPGPSVLDAARQAIKYGENAEVYAEGGYLVTDVQGPIEDPVLVRSDEHTDGAKDYADAAALSSNFASARAKDAEAYAIGSRDGEPVTSDDPAYHNNALYYAGQAANSASDAHADAVAAHDDAVNAHADAQAAAGSASDASGYATAAGNAKTAAQSAQGYAEAAQTGAETAEGNAEAWSVGQRDGVDVPATDPAYNNNAKYYAGQAAASAAQAAQTAASIAADFAYLTAPDGISQIGLYQDRDATPGAIVTFADGAAVPAKSASIGVEPVQDLHGQANPWPAGGGKNKFNKDAAFSASPIVTVTPTNTGFKMVSSSGSSYLAGSQQYSTLNGAYILTFGYSVTSGAVRARVSKVSDGSLIAETTLRTSGSGTEGLNFTASEPVTIAFFCTGGTSVIANVEYSNVMIRLATETDPAFAPYENICPITGWTGADITVNGVNQWDEEWEAGYIDGDGNHATAYNQICTKNFIPVEGGKTYYCKCPLSAAITTAPVAYYDAGQNFISRPTATMGADGFAFTTPDNARYIKISFSPNYGAAYNNDISINYPATDTAYHAYAGKTVAVDWTDEAGTVYGGTLAYLGGNKYRLTADHKVKVFDGTETPAYGAPYSNPNGGYNMWFQYVGCGMSDCKMVVGDSPKRSDRFSYTPRQLINQNNIPIWSISGNVRSADGYIFFSFPLEYDTNAKILAWFAANKTQVWYEIATPLVYDITADELATLLGDNVIFSDTGDIEELTYRTSENSRTIVLGTSLSGVLEAIAGFIGVSE